MAKAISRNYLQENIAPATGKADAISPKAALRQAIKIVVINMPTVNIMGPESKVDTETDPKADWSTGTLQKDIAKSDQKSQLRCSSCLYPRNSNLDWMFESM
jgi:hypothetical protein